MESMNGDEPSEDVREVEMDTLEGDAEAQMDEEASLESEGSLTEEDDAPSEIAEAGEADADEPEAEFAEDEEDDEAAWQELRQDLIRFAENDDDEGFSKLTAELMEEVPNSAELVEDLLRLIAAEIFLAQAAPVWICADSVWII